MLDGERGRRGIVKHHPEIDKYAGLSSPIHNWDPRAKLVAILVLIVAIVLIPDLKIALIGLAIALTLAVITRIPFSFMLNHLKWVIIFIVPLFVIVSLTPSGGIERAALISVRALAAIILIFPMIGTMRFDTTIKALEKLRIPSKLVQMIMFTYRYIFVLTSEVQRMFTSLNSRGFHKRTSLYTLSTMGKLLGMMFVRSHERSERVFNAMVSRGYEGNLKTLVDFELHTADILKAAILIAIAVALDVVCLTVV
jgi:cobalt/nickel transport system permease protein